MKKKIFGSLLVLAIAAVAAFNVNLNTQDSNLSTLALANVEALAQESGGGVTWNCSTYTSETYNQEGYDYDCGYYIVSKWETRSCNNGIITWCYPGYITTYYNCNGSVSSVNNQTNTSGCL
ncbi:NVEALA domain-containing protein [Dysgonomonas reticulitermitis]